MPTSQNSTRKVVHFSCGAASAVAAKLTLSNQNPDTEVAVINSFVKEEHPDNRRFLEDCEKWLGTEIVILRNETYDASAYEVFKRKRFLKNRNGAPCSKILKKEVLLNFCSPDDIHVLGLTIEEEDRLNRIIDADPNLQYEAPLIDANLSKSDCLALVEKAGLVLPLMYRLGYNNANCVGCVKGGQGYWNRIRKDFPEVFNKMMELEEFIGPNAYLFRDRKTQNRFGLRQLPENSGRHKEPEISCSFLCEYTEFTDYQLN